MASYTNNAGVQWDATSDANFRSMIQFVHNAFTGTNSSWVQTSDTGQINPSTVTAPAQNAYAGYTVYKINDALASACPIFVRFDWGANNAVTKGVGIKATIGTGSDGAGTITGAQVVTLATTGTAVASTAFTGAGAISGTGASLWDSYAALSAGRAGFLLWRNHSNATAPSIFAIERSLDSNGNYTAAYFTVISMGNNTSGSQMWVIFKPGTGASVQMGANGSTGSVFPVVHSTVASLIFGSNAPMSPIFPLIGRVDNGLTVLGAVKTGDQSEAAQFQSTLYNVSHTFVYTKAGNAFTMDSGANWAPALRFD